MNLRLLLTLTAYEVRLRLRRRSTMVAFFAVMAISWVMIPDPGSGRTLMSIGKAHVEYTSAAMALGSAVLAGVVLGLGGFYLVRGRIAEDIRSGIGAVIASTKIPSFILIISGWLGSIAYLLLLVAVFAATTLTYHAVYGSAPIEPLIYLSTYSIVLLPLMIWVCSCAVLFDSIAALAGKAGDVIFAMLWTASLTVLGVGAIAGAKYMVPFLVFDFSGIAMTHLISEMQFHSSAVKFGSFFDPSLPALTLPTVMWTNEMILIRCATAGLAALLLIPAGLCFHRYSPDKIKVAHTQKRRSMVSLINGWIQPVSVVVRPMFSVSAKLPLFWGQIIADIALTLVTSPLAVVLLIASLVATFTVDATQLPVLLGVSGLVWGILVSEVSTRDYQAACEEMTGTVIGGGTRRYLRQFAAAFGLGLLFTGAIGLRLAIDDPQRAATLFIGLFSLSALATLFGRCSRTTSMFTAVFLAWLYVAISMRVVPIVDVLGFNGVANTNTVLVQLAIGAAATAIGYLYNTKQGR